MSRLNKHLLEVYSELGGKALPHRFGSDEQVMGAIIVRISDLKAMLKSARISPIPSAIFWTANGASAFTTPSIE